MSYLKLKDLTIHPQLERVLPSIEEREYQRIRGLIDQNGYDKNCPIWVWTNCKEYPNCIVDGHNRFKICQELGIEPEILECEYDDLVQAKNAALRSAAGRQLSESQRAQWAIDLEASQVELDAWKRAQEGRSLGGRGGKSVAPVPQTSDETDYQPKEQKSRKKLADKARTGEKTVGAILSLRHKLETEPELSEELQDMIRNNELQAKTAGEFASYPIEVIKDIIKGGANAIKKYVYEQRAIAKAAKEEEKKQQTNRQKNEEYKNSEEFKRRLDERKEVEKEFKQMHDETSELLRQRYGDDYNNIGKVCFVDQPNTYEMWCELCQDGFDTFIGPHKAQFCPYCGENRIREREAGWIPGRVGED